MVRLAGVNSTSFYRSSGLMWVLPICYRAHKKEVHWSNEKCPAKAFRTDSDGAKLFPTIGGPQRST